MRSTHDGPHSCTQPPAAIATTRQPSANQPDDPLSLLAAYTWATPERKQRRDRILCKLADVQQATFGLAELVAARVTLLAHQAEVVMRVLADPVCRFILADEVGLGKTIEACLILCALRNEDSQISTLILAPAALLRQWQNELHYKFGLRRFVIVTQRDTPPAFAEKSSILVAYEDMEASTPLWQAISSHQWGLLIADEAHHLRRRQGLFERVRRLSRTAQRALILTATPVQRRAVEYLDLLRLMHPAHYSTIDLPAFARMLKAQGEIRDTINYLGRGMDPADFDAGEFGEEMERIVAALDDPALRNLVAGVAEAEGGHSLAAAQTALDYVKDNYRIESRVIRNRRTNLADGILPVRQLNIEYMYDPQPPERAALESLHDYADACLRAAGEDKAAAEYCRLLFHAAASSPHALQQLTAVRTDNRAAEHARQGSDPLLRQFADLCPIVPPFADEERLLNGLAWHVSRWRDGLERTLATALRSQALVTVYDHPYRLAQVMRAALKLVRRTNAKILVFTSFHATLDLLRRQIETALGFDAVAEFSARQTPGTLQIEADWFQKSPDCHILITDETGGEGRNFQIADAVIHVDLPWTPAAIEQRIGRVDRLGRSGQVTSIVPVARNTLEEQLFNLWDQGYGIFERSMSGLEIALEEVQDHIMQAFTRNSRFGLAEMLPWLIQQAQKLHASVEEERYFEEGAIDWRRRSEFERISSDCQDGEWLREDVLEWSRLGRKDHIYDAQTKIAVIGPRGVNLAAVAKAAQVRHGQGVAALNTAAEDWTAIGVFHREVAVRREDLLFFTAGQLHVKKILDSAVEDISGRCCAVQVAAPVLNEDWCGFEFLYRVKVDSRPLLAAGLPKSHLRRIQGYLPATVLRVLAGIDGTIVRPDSPVHQRIMAFIAAEPGQDRRARQQPLSPSAVQQMHAPGEWQAIIAQAAAAAAEEVKDCLAAGCDQRVAIAAAELSKSVASQWAAHRWLYHEADSVRTTEIRQLEAANAALLAGLAAPRYRLESVCFWLLRASPTYG